MGGIPDTPGERRGAVLHRFTHVLVRRCGRSYGTRVFTGPNVALA